MGIPLHLALRGIEKAFDLGGKTAEAQRQIAPLLSGRGEAQYAEWLESRVGASAGEGH